MLYRCLRRVDFDRAYGPGEDIDLTDAEARALLAVGAIAETEDHDSPPGNAEAALKDALERADRAEARAGQAEAALKDALERAEQAEARAGQAAPSPQNTGEAKTGGPGGPEESERRLAIREALQRIHADTGRKPTVKVLGKAAGVGAVKAAERDEIWDQVLLAAG